MKNIIVGFFLFFIPVVVSASDLSNLGERASSELECVTASTATAPRAARRISSAWQIKRSTEAEKRAAKAAR